jgi:hypothetical protein
MGITTDLYSLDSNQPEKQSHTRRECSVCGGSISPQSQVWLPKAETAICGTCATDLYQTLAPKATTIPVSTAKTATRAAGGGRDVFSTERFKQNFIREASSMLLGLIK